MSAPILGSHALQIVSMPLSDCQRDFSPLLCRPAQINATGTSKAPMLRGETLMSNSEWSELLANDYCTPRHHISFARAIYDRQTERAYVELRRPDGGG